jgi:hypothetical protein
VQELVLKSVCHHETLPYAYSTDSTLVQLLILMGQYLQGTQKSSQTWKIHGLSVRAAFQLGLQSSDLARAFPALDREIRKRTWFGCIQLDRTLSMTFGRPAAIPDVYVRMELPVDFSAYPGVVVQDPTKELLSVGFFNATQ